MNSNVLQVAEQVEGVIKHLTNIHNKPSVERKVQNINVDGKSVDNYLVYDLKEQDKMIAVMFNPTHLSVIVGKHNKDENGNYCFNKDDSSFVIIANEIEKIAAVKEKNIVGSSVVFKNLITEYYKLTNVEFNKFYEEKFIKDTSNVLNELKEVDDTSSIVLS